MSHEEAGFGATPIDGVVAAPRQTRLLGILLLLLYSVVAACLLFVPWQQNVRGRGRVVAYAPIERQQTIQAPIEGRVKTWYVREGSRVKKGDPIVDLVDNDPHLVDQLRRERDAQQARLDAAHMRATSIDSRIDSLGTSRKAAVIAATQRADMASDRIKAAVHALAASEAQVRAADLHLARQEGLHVDGLTSKRTLELAQADAVKARTEVDRAQATLSAARRDEAALSSDQTKIGSDATAGLHDAAATRSAALAEIASAEAELARIEVRLSRQAAQSVIAPRDGTILRIVVPDGAGLVKATDPLALLVPDTEERAVEIWLDGNDVPLTRVGRHVRLQFEGWPAVQFAGWPQVSVGTFGGKVVLVDSADDGKGKFRVLVLPDGNEPWPATDWLRQGTRANGWVILDRVSLGYELWRQMNGFPPSTAEPATTAGKAGGKP